MKTKLLIVVGVLALLAGGYATGSKEPGVSALRDKDRMLWAKSFEKQLNDDILTLFKKRA